MYTLFKRKASIRNWMVELMVMSIITNQITQFLSFIIENKHIFYLHLKTFCSHVTTLGIHINLWIRPQQKKEFF